MHREKNSFAKALAEGLLMFAQAQAQAPTVYDGMKNFVRPSQGSVVIEHRRNPHRAAHAGSSVSHNPSSGHANTERYLKKG